MDSLKNRILTMEGLPKANALYELAKIYTEFNIDSARLFVDEALAICRSLKNDTTYTIIASGMQYSLGRAGEKDLAHKYLISTRNLKSPEAMIAKYRTLTYVGLYFIHYWSYTQYDSSVYYGLLTVDLVSDAISKADRSIIVGAAYNKMGDNIKAHESGCTVNVAALGSGVHIILFNGQGLMTSYSKFMVVK